MKKIAALFCLVFALLACAVPSVHADDDSAVPIPPDGPCTVVNWIFNGQQVTTYEYTNLTEIDFSDGSVEELDTSDGSDYTLDFTADGSSSFITQWNQGTVVSQWIVTAD